MQSLIKQLFFLVLLACLTPFGIAQSNSNFSDPHLASDSNFEFDTEMNINADWLQQQYFGIKTQKQQESGEFIITELPDMDSKEARQFLEVTLPGQLKERSLDHEIRAPCNRQSRKCDVEIYLFSQKESSKQLVEIMRLTVLLGAKPVAEPDHSSKPAIETETASIQEPDLPELEPDWIEKVHVYRNQETGDNLVIRDNIVYYSGQSLYILLRLFNVLLFQSGPVDTTDGYYGHFSNAQILAETLAAGDMLPALIRDHGMAYVSPQLDATGYALALAIYGTYVHYWDKLVLNKKEMTASDLRMFYAWKLFANIATKAINEFASQNVFTNETDDDIHKMKSSLFTSLVIALPYGTKLLVSAFTGNNYANHILKAVPADHLLSCSISVSGVCLQLFFHRILGEADTTIVPATALEPAKKVTSGLSYIPSAITQVAMGKAFNALGMTVCGGHYIKGAGYALVDGVDKYLIAQGASDLSRYTALTIGALFMSYSNYSFSKAFASGFSFRYSKYLMILASTAVMTWFELYFHTTTLR